MLHMIFAKHGQSLQFKFAKTPKVKAKVKATVKAKMKAKVEAKVKIHGLCRQLVKAMKAKAIRELDPTDSAYCHAR